MTFPFASLPENLAAFCDVLRREYGFRIGPRELEDAAHALELADLLDEREVRNVMRPVLGGTFADVQVFDRAFDRFFGAFVPPPLTETLPSPPGPSQEQNAENAEETHRVHRTSADDAPEVADADGGLGSVLNVTDEDNETAVGFLRASYSPFEAEGPAVHLEPVDGEWRDAAARLVQRIRTGWSRRWHPARRGQRFDFRRTVRSSLHTGGDLMLPRWRVRSLQKPRFVLLLDGSRSMSSDAEAALRVAVALTSVARSTETFTFSTALMRVTPDIRRAAAGERRQLLLHHAWGGGTTIGACLAQFVRRFGERLMNRVTVIIIASDGLDVGDVHLLREVMSSLARRAAMVVWLNPLLETPGYEPTASGMNAARPFVTTFAAVTDAAGLARLARIVPNSRSVAVRHAGG